MSDQHQVRFACAVDRRKSKILLLDMAADCALVRRLVGLVSVGGLEPVRLELELVLVDVRVLEPLDRYGVRILLDQVSGWLRRPQILAIPGSLFKLEGPHSGTLAHYFMAGVLLLRYLDDLRVSH